MRVSKVPIFADYPDPRNSTPNRIPLGLSECGEVFWDVEKSPNMLIVGDPQSGKSNILGNLFFHCMRNPDSWRVYGLDVIGNTLNPYRKFLSPAGEWDIATGNGELSRVTLKSLERTMQDRQEYWSDYSDTRKIEEHVLLVVDEAWVYTNADDYGKSDLAIERHRIIGNVIRYGYEVGVHVAMASSYVNAPMLSGGMNRTNTLRVATGGDTEGFPRIKINQSYESLNSTIGRAYMQTGETEIPVEFQPYILDPSSRDTYLMENDFRSRCYAMNTKRHPL